MKLSHALFSTLVIAGAAAPASAGLLNKVLGWGDGATVITSTDVFADAASLPEVSKDKPVYYVAISAGYRDFGASIAGEKIPENKAVLDLVTKTLHSRGYRLGDNQNPPSLVIIYSWGTLFAERWLDYSGYYPQGAHYRVMNRGQILNFLGGHKLDLGYKSGANTLPEYQLARGLSWTLPSHNFFAEMSEDDYYVVTIRAYDLSAAEKSEAKELWRTNISCYSRGNYLPEVMPTMLAIAAPHIGKHTDKPVVIRADEHYKPSIEIGPAQVIEDE